MNHSALSFIISAFPSGRSIDFLAGKIQLEPTSDSSWFTQVLAVETGNLCTGIFFLIVKHTK